MAQISLCGKLQFDVEIKAPADKFYEVYTKAYLTSKCCPDKIQAVDLHAGQWGTEGSVTLWKYLIEGKTAICKVITETIDYENKSVTMKTIEGDLLELYKSIKFNFQAIPQGEGCLVRWTFEYEKLNENVPDPSTLRELTVDTTKGVGAYLTRA